MYLVTWIFRFVWLYAISLKYGYGAGLIHSAVWGICNFNSILDIDTGEQKLLFNYQCCIIGHDWNWIATSRSVKWRVNMRRNMGQCYFEFESNLLEFCRLGSKWYGLDGHYLMDDFCAYCWVLCAGCYACGTVTELLL